MLTGLEYVSLIREMVEDVNLISCSKQGNDWPPAKASKLGQGSIFLKDIITWFGGREVSRTVSQKVLLKLSFKGMLVNNLSV